MSQIVQKLYTERYYTHPYKNGIAHLLPITLPRIELQRGEIAFEVGEGAFELEKKKNYFEVSLVRGTDTYGILSADSDNHKIFRDSKASAIDYINDRIKNSIFNHPERQTPEIVTPEWLDSQFKRCNPQQTIEILTRMVKFLSRETVSSGRFAEEKALAHAFGYKWQDGCYMEYEYVNQNINNEMVALMEIDAEMRRIEK